MIAIRRPMMGCILAACLLGAGCATTGYAQNQPDVPYVPTPQNVVDAMLEMANVGPADYVIDLGSGDGRILITAARKYGARGFGVDIDGGLVHTAQREAARQGVQDKVKFYERNLFITDLAGASVITTYLLQNVNIHLRPRMFAELKPGTRIVSHEFDFGNWQPDAQRTLSVPGKTYGPPSSHIYLWVIPADASGTWQWRLPGAGAAQDFEVTFEQTFQMLDGTPRVGQAQAQLGNARMRGSEISLVITAPLSAGGRVTRHEFSGRIAGERIEGKVLLSGAVTGQYDWSAMRVARGKFNINAGAAAPALAVRKD